MSAVVFVAPFDGKAGIVKVNVGQYVNIGTEIVRVEDTSSMKVDFAISQNELDKLHIGQRVTATTDARKGETFFSSYHGYSNQQLFINGFG